MSDYATPDCDLYLSSSPFFPTDKLVKHFPFVSCYLSSTPKMAHHIAVLKNKTGVYLDAKVYRRLYNEYFYDNCRSFLTYGEFLCIVSYLTNRDFRDFGNEYYNRFIWKFTGMAAVNILTKILPSKELGWDSDLSKDLFKNNIVNANEIDWARLTKEEIFKVCELDYRQIK